MLKITEQGSSFCSIMRFKDSNSSKITYQKFWRGGMGRQLIKMSRWSCKSIFSLYSKVITIIFALFCVITGQINKTESSENEETKSHSLRGIALNAKDSTVMGNIRLFLCEELAVMYGSLIRLSDYIKLDSTYTDDTGYFKFSVDEPVRYYPFVLVHGTEYSTYVSEWFYFDDDKDSIHTVYLTHRGFSSVKNAISNSNVNQMYTYQGKTLVVRIPDFNEKNAKVKIVNLKGEKIETLQTSEDGSIRWNTRSVSKGVYIMNVAGSRHDLNLRVVVK
ncbi:hypothetical protein CHISP_3073 [Chitinispirillum alkaliphilum]|nr:hypothetical protein CHISP_3073 [Chitinispirillum alkaliphilum]